LTENPLVIIYDYKRFDFTTFLKKKNIDVILWSDRLGKVKKPGSDPEWDKFMTAPHLWDFTCMNISNVSKFRVCVRE